MNKILGILITVFVISVIPLHGSYSSNIGESNTLHKQTEQKTKARQQKPLSTDARLKKLIRSRPQRIDWKDKINFTKEQRPYIDDIYKNSDNQVNLLIKEIENSLEKIGEIYEDEEQKIKQILNEKQLAKFEKIKRRTVINSGGEWKGENHLHKKMRRY